MHFHWELAGIVLIVLLGVLVYLHMQWHRIGTRLGRATYFTDKNGLTPEGWTHFAFMVVQGTIIVTVVLSRAASWWYALMLACLFMYLLSWILIIRYIRHVELRSKAEYPFIVLGLLAVVVRCFLLFAGI